VAATVFTEVTGLQRMRGGFCGCRYYGFWREIDLSQRGGGDLGDYKWSVEEKKDEWFRSLWGSERRTPVNEEEGYGAVS